MVRCCGGCQWWLVGAVGDSLLFWVGNGCSGKGVAQGAARHGRTNNLALYGDRTNAVQTIQHIDIA